MSSEKKVEVGSDTTRTPITETKMKITATPYRAGRKDPDFKEENTEDIKTYPGNENKEKQALRISTQKAGGTSYEYKGKKEFAGYPAKKDTSYSDSTYTKETITPKYEEKTDTVIINRGKPNLKKALKSRELAPGLGNRPNILKQKY